MTTPTPCILERLCPKLQLSVFDYLGYFDAIRLSQVSHYFHNLVDPDSWPRLERELALLGAQRWTRYNAFRRKVGMLPPGEPRYEVISNGFACFDCLRVLQKDSFSRTQTMHRHGKGSERRERFCLDCGIKREIYRPGIVAQPTTDKPTRWSDSGEVLILCETCQAFQHFETDPEETLMLCCACCAAEGVAPMARRTFRLRCTACENHMEFASSARVWLCGKCGKELCGECSSKNPMALYGYFCNKLCKKESRRGRLIAEKEAKRPWKSGVDTTGG